MKTRNIFLSLIMVLCAAFLVGCSEDDRTPVLTNIEPGTLDNLPVSAIVLEAPEKGTNPLLITVTWTETKFYLDKTLPVAPVRYMLEADRAGNNFARPVALAAAVDLYANLYVNDINTILLRQFEAEPGEVVPLELRLVTAYGEEVKAENKVISSKTLALSLTPYNPAKEITPVYIIGNMNGWTNNNSDAAKTFLMFRDDNDSENMVYTYTGRIGADSYFKFAAEDELGDWAKMYCMGDNGQLTFGDLDAFNIADEGYYTITINIDAMTYSIEPFDMTGVVEWPIMNFVGAFCDWGDGDSDPEMTPRTVQVNNGADIIDPHIWTWEGDLDNIEWGVKFRANHSWDTRWCPKDSSENPYGVAEFNQPADNNIDISKQGLGRYYVIFNDLTGHYYVKLKD